MTSRSGVLLDIDPSIINNNLLLKENVDDNKDAFFQSLFDKDSQQVSLKEGEKVDINSKCRLVKPIPGFCIKNWKDNGEKFFINVCHTEHIPPPNPITEEQILKLMYDTDDDSISPENFRIPLSIGNLHSERDKSSRPCEVCDVALNSDFYNQKVCVNNNYKRFVITLALEGVIDKYSMSIDQGKETVILKHSRFMGKIENQMLQIRGTNEKRLEVGSATRKPLIEEIKEGDKKVNSIESSAKKIDSIITECPYQILLDAETAANSTNGVTQKKPKNITVNVLVNRLNVTQGKDVTLDVGEDRLLLRTTRIDPLQQVANAEEILLDVFLPYNVRRDNCFSHFNKDNKVLTVHIPVAT